MSSVTITCDYDPIPDGEDTGFLEVSLPNGCDTVVIDVPLARVAALAFGAGFEGGTITVKATVPWAAGDAVATVTGQTITVTAGEVVPLEYKDRYAFKKLTLLIDTAQTAAHDLGVFVWRG